MDAVNAVQGAATVTRHLDNSSAYRRRNVLYSTVQYSTHATGAPVYPFIDHAMPVTIHCFVIVKLVLSMMALDCRRWTMVWTIVLEVSLESN